MPQQDRVAMAQRVAEMSNAYFAVSNEVVQGRYAKYIVNADAPVIRDANHAQEIRCTTETELDGLLAEMDAVYANCPHRAVRPLPDTPEPVLARLAFEGYAHDDGVLLYLGGDLRAEPKPFDVRPVTTDEDWATLLRLQQLNRDEEFGNQDLPVPAGLVEQFHRVKRANAHAVHYWFVDVDGEARAYCSSWPGVGGIGLIEDLYTHAEYRHRGIATALIAHCLNDARARGAGPCVIPADVTDTPRHMYFALGFTPIATSVMLLKKLEAAESGGVSSAGS